MGSGYRLDCLLCAEWVASDGYRLDCLLCAEWVASGGYRGWIPYSVPNG
jgi:hypothetical protein